MTNTNEAVLREALEKIVDSIPAYSEGQFFTEHFTPDGEQMGVQNHDPVSIIGYIEVAARAALAATATVAKDCGEPIDYAGDFVKLAIDEAEKRGLDYVSTRILRALLAKHATLKPEASTEPIILEQDHPEAARWYGMGYLDGTEASAEQPAVEECICVAFRRDDCAYCAAPIIKQPEVKMKPMIQYEQANGSTTYKQYVKDAVPKWAINVRPYVEAAPISEDTGKANSSSAAPSDWKQAVFDACTVAFIDCGESSNPRRAIESLIAAHVDIALDPTVSERAAALAAPSPTGESLSARNAALEEAAQIVSEEICSCCWNEEAQAFAEHAADAIRALKTVPGEPT